MAAATGTLAAAVRLLTIIPVPVPSEFDAAAMSRSVALFPLVGLAIGGTTAGVAWLASLVMPDLVAAALAVVAAVALTGALHLDGLADTADGLFGGRTPQRRLEIMRDPHIGVFGAVAVALVLLLKLATVSALVGAGEWAAIALVPALGRLAAVAVTGAFPYVRADGLGAPFAGAGRIAIGLAGATAVAAALVLAGPWGLAVFGGALLAGLAVGRLAAAKLSGGVTGDVYGAAVEAGEVVALFTLVGLTGGSLSIAPVWV